MANESIAFDVELKTAKAATGVQSLRTELKNLRNQLATLDEGSAEFSKIAAKAGAVQDKIGDLKDTIAAFHPERKFQAFTGVIQGVAGGFAAAQGAMALFGSESEDLQKTLIKVQGAMALSQGLNSLMGMGDAFKNLKLIAVSSFTTIRTAAIATFATIKGALVATGIGALIVAIGLLVSEVIDYNAAIDETIDQEKRLREGREKDIALMEKQVEKTEKLRNAKKGNIDELKRELLLIEASGGTAEDIYKKKKEILEKELYNLRVAAQSGLDVTKEGQDKKNEIEALGLAFKKNIQDENDKKDKEAAEKAKEKAAAKLEEDKKNQQRYFDFLVSSKESEKVLWDKSVEDFIAAEDEKFKRLKGFRDAEVEYDDLMLERKKNNFADITSLLTSFSSMAGQQSEEGKALAIAAALIDTYTAAWSIFKNAAKTEGNPYTPWLHASAAIAGGLLNVQKIISVDAQGQTSAGGGNTSAPPPMTRPQSSRVSFDSGGKPISVSDKSKQRVYVVERDITNAQNRVALIQARAKIG